MSDSNSSPDDPLTLVVDRQFLRSVFEASTKVALTGAKADGSRSRYDNASSAAGQERCRGWFSQHILGSDQRLDEAAFISLMEKFTNLPSHEVLDFFDILDVHGNGELDFDTFHLVLSMYLAYDCMECSKFLSQHGRRIFDILHAPEFDDRGISAERAKVFGRLCGISEAQLVRALNAASISFTDLMQYQDFVRVYSDVFGDFDRWRAKKAQPSAAAPSSSVCCCTIM